MKKISTATKSGFTIVEVSIAMAFLATLLITISILIMTILGIYQKGITLKEVNATGRELVDEFSRAVSSAPAKDALRLCAGLSSGRDKCEKDNAYLFIYHQATTTDIKEIYSDSRNAPVSLEQPVPTHGVFCTGRYSYIWNSGYALNHFKSTNDNRYLAQFTYKLNQNGGVSNKTIRDFRLLKVPDDNRVLCAKHVNNNYEVNNNNNFNVASSLTLTREPVELLSENDNSLALYDLRVFPPSQHIITGHSFYSGTFTLATLAGGVNITGTGDYCSDPPDDLNTDFVYCAVNKFNFAVRATGELTDEEKQQQ